MKKSMLTLTVLGLVLAAVSAAQALPVSVQYVKASPSKDVKVVTPFTNNGYYRLGVCELKIDLGDGNGAQTAYGFCVDVKQSVSYSMKPYELEALENAPRDHNSGYGPMGVTKANAIRELWGENFTAAQSSATSAAALQLAIWEVIFEDDANSWNAASGDMYAKYNTSVINAANSMLANVDGQGTLETTLQAVTCDLGETKYQDFVIAFAGGEKPPVPEPLTMVTALLGLCGLGGYVRKRTVA